MVKNDFKTGQMKKTTNEKSANGKPANNKSAAYRSIATVAVKEVLFVSWRRAATAALVPLGAVLLIALLLTGFEEAYQLLLNPPEE